MRHLPQRVTCPGSMTLRDLMGTGAPEVEISGLAYSSQSVTPGALFFCVPGFRSDGHDFAPDAVERGAAALVTRAPRSTSACPRWWWTTCGRRWARPRRASTATRPRSSTWSASPARTARPPPPSSSATCSRRPGARRACSARSSAWWAGWRRRSSGRRPRRSTSRRPSGACSTRGDRAVRDGGLLARARARPRGRASASPCRVFTNLTQDHLDFHETMDAYFAAKRRLFEEPGPVGGERRRRVRPPDRRRGRRRDLRRSSATPTTARATSTST